jgi:hypothetical protein
MSYEKTAFDKTTVTLSGLAERFSKLRDNAQIIEAINEIEDSRKIGGWFGKFKGTSADENRNLALGILATVVNQYKGVFLNKLPLGFDRLADFLLIIAGFIALSANLKIPIRMFFSKINTKINRNLNQTLYFEFEKFDKDNQPIPGTHNWIPIKMDDLVFKGEDAVKEAIENKAHIKDTDGYRMKFYDGSVLVLKETYDLVSAIDRNSLKVLAGVGGATGAWLAPSMIQTSRGEAPDTAGGRKGTQQSLPPKRINLPSGKKKQDAPGSR